MAKCKEEFDNRTKATASKDEYYNTTTTVYMYYSIVSVINKDDLTSEKDDEKGVVKRKMLGNVKFIGMLQKAMINVL